MPINHRIGWHALNNRPVTLFLQVQFALEIQQMPGFFRLGTQVKLVIRVGWNDQRDASVDGHTVPGQVLDLPRVVGDQPDGSYFQRKQHVRSHGIVAFIVAKAQGKIGFHSVIAMILQSIRTDLIGEADPRPSWRI